MPYRESQHTAMTTISLPGSTELFWPEASEHVDGFACCELNEYNAPITQPENNNVTSLFNKS